MFHPSCVQTSNSPFVIEKFHIGRIQLSYDTRWKLELQGVTICLDVTRIPNENSDEQESVCAAIRQKAEKVETVSTPFLGNTEEGLRLLAEYVHESLHVAVLQMLDINIHIKSSIRFLDENIHEMSVEIEQIRKQSCTDVDMRQWKWNVCRMRFFACRNKESNVALPNIEIDEFIVTSRHNTLSLDFLNKTVHTGFCGDSNFLVSVLSQNVFENRRLLSIRNARRIERNEEKQRLHSNVGTEIAESLETNVIQERLDHDDVPFKADAECERLHCNNVSSRVVIENISLLADFYRGSDVQGTRILGDGLTVKLLAASAVYESERERLDVFVRKIQTTVGYVDEPVRLNMTNDGGYWDANLSIPSVYIRTRQAIVDTMLTLFTFNLIWNEYDMLYSNADTIKFRTFIVDDVHVRFKYYNSPVDYRKILKGNWRHLVRLIPHCDLSIALPAVILKYQVGWEDAVNSYIKELLTTQRIRCVRKVVIGTAKRKIKGLFKAHLSLP